MEKIGLLNYVLIALTFTLTVIANLSADHARRRRFHLAALLCALFLISLLSLRLFDRSQGGFFESRILTANLFVGIGLILPQLISRIFARQKIQHPLVFLKGRKVSLLSVLIPGACALLIAWTALAPNKYDLTLGGPVYDEFYVQRSLSFLVYFIPMIILAIQMLVERTAICENGLYQHGLLSAWSNFGSYSWSQGEMYTDPEIQPLLTKDILVELKLEPKIKLWGARVQLFIPLKEKKAIDDLLSGKVRMAQNMPVQSHSSTTA